MWGIAMSPRPRISWYFMIVIDQGGFEAMIWFWNGPQNGRVFRVPMSLPPTRRCFEAVSCLQGTSSFSPVWSVCSFPPGRNRSDFAERVSMSQQWLSAWFIDRWSGTMRWFDQPSADFLLGWSKATYISRCVQKAASLRKHDATGLQRWPWGLQRTIDLRNF